MVLGGYNPAAYTPPHPLIERMCPCIYEYFTEENAMRAYRGTEIGIQVDTFLIPALDEDTQRRGV